MGNRHLVEMGGQVAGDTSPVRRSGDAATGRGDSDVWGRGDSTARLRRSAMVHRTHSERTKGERRTTDLGFTGLSQGIWLSDNLIWHVLACLCKHN